MGLTNTTTTDTADMNEEKQQESVPDSSGENESTTETKAPRARRSLKKKYPEEVQPRTAFHFFQSKKSKELRESSCTPTTSTVLGKMWKELPEQEKQEFIDLAAQDKLRYEMKLESLGHVWKHKRPKRPTPANMRWFHSVRKEYQERNKCDYATTLKELGSQWCTMTEEEKKPFKDAYEKEKEEFKNS